ncbi:MAG: substrate-binding domain-containing protein, partial [Pseudomonadota bacterium]
LGYTRDVNAATLARKNPYRFVFLVPKSSTQFSRSLSSAIEETALTHASHRCSVELVQAPMFSPHDAAAAVKALNPSDIDGLAIMAPETPSVRDAVIKMREAGVEVVPIISDLPTAQCGHFVGINNIAAGRTAAELLGRFCAPRKGTVAVIVGNMVSRDHIERRLGFDEVIGSLFPQLQTLPTSEGRDQAELVERIATRLLQRHDDLAGIYLASAGTAGLHRAVIAHLEARGKRPFVIAHELTATTRSALSDNVFDAVISQDVGHIARSAVRVLRARKDGAPISKGQERIRIDIFTRGNVPDEPDHSAIGGEA